MVASDIFLKRAVNEMDALFLSSSCAMKILVKRLQGNSNLGKDADLLPSLLRKINLRVKRCSRIFQEL